MSIDHNEFDQMVEGLELDVNLKHENLNLKKLGERSLADLREFKAARLDMIAQREALKKAIKIMDKRIEITLEALKTLQTPT